MAASGLTHSKRTSLPSRSCAISLPRGASVIRQASPEVVREFLAFLGEPTEVEPLAPGPDGRSPGLRVTERLRLIHTGFDLGAQGNEALRTFVEEGPYVGTVRHTLRFEQTTAAGSVPLTSTDGEFEFVDAGGAVVGTLRADIAEGKVFTDDTDTGRVVRRAGLGPLRGGTGPFDGAAGMMTMNAGADVSSFYVIRVSDVDGRFRAAFADAGAGAAVGATGAAAEPLKDDEWSLRFGDITPALQVPSRHEARVTRTLSNPRLEPKNSHGRTPHQMLGGMTTPNAVSR